jgi:hypothetical protein
MFWSTPTLPIEKEEQEWIESSLQWMLTEFGREYFLSKPTILPRRESFPDFQGTEECVPPLVEKIAGYMDVDFKQLDIEMFDAENSAETDGQHAGETRFQGPAGLYSQDENRRMQIRISDHCLENYLSLVATVAHELGHARLLGEARISAELRDHEYLTDLVCVFLGMGIFTANAAFQFNQWQDSSHQGWNASRSGYLSEAMLGYALAACCWMKGEDKPAWSTSLAINVGHYFRKSLAYLNKGGWTALSKLR